MSCNCSCSISPVSPPDRTLIAYLSVKCSTQCIDFIQLDFIHVYVIENICFPDKHAVAFLVVLSPVEAL